MFCKDDIRISLTNQINTFLTEGKSAADINALFKTPVLGEGGTIAIPQELIDKYWEANQPKGNYFYQLNAFNDLFDNPQTATRLKEKANTELNKKLSDYLKKYNVTIKEVESIQAITGTDSAGVVDILNKIILLDKNKQGLDTLPEEAGHIFTTMMSHTKDMDWMLENIDKWEGYKEVYSDYFSKYEGDEKKIKFEAVGKFIALHLIKNEPTVSAEIKEGILNRLWKFIKELFGDRTDIEKLNEIANNIAVKVLNDESLIDISIPEGHKQVNIDQAFKTDYQAKAIHEKLKDKFLLTGSAALSTQGTVYRNDENPLHDLDYVVPDVNIDISKEIKEIFPNSTPVHNGILNKDYTTKAFLIPPAGISVRNVTHQTDGNYAGWITGYELYDKKNKLVGKFESKFEDGKLLQRQQGLKGFWVDFFEYKKDPKLPAPMVPGFSNWDRTFKAKLEFAREKDIKDWINYKTPYLADAFNNEYTFHQLNTNDGENEALAKVGEAYKGILNTNRTKDLAEDSVKTLEKINTDFPLLHADIIVEGEQHRIVVEAKSDLGEDYLKAQEAITPKQRIDSIKAGERPNQGERIKLIYDKIKNVAKENGIRKLGDKEGYVDGTGKPLQRITDKVKEFYKKIFKKTADDFTAEEKADNEQKAERGTEFHKDMENMFRLFIDPYSGKKTYGSREEMDKIDISSFVPTMKVSELYKDNYLNLIAGYVKDKLDSYSPDARFLFETVLYNKKYNRAGTADVIVIDDKGIDILDWKTIYKLSEDGKIYPTKKQGFNIQLNEYYNAIKYSVPFLSDEDFNEIRVIPVLPRRNPDGFVSGIEIGKVKPSNDPISLLPVLSEKDVAYKGSIKKFLNSINEVLTRENKRLARETGFKNIQDYELKQEVEDAITQVIVQQNPDALLTFITDIQQRADKYLKEVDDFIKSPAQATEEDRINFQEKLRDAAIAIGGIQDFLGFSMENLDEYIKASPENEAKITSYTVSIQKHTKTIETATKGYVDKIARSQNISAINKPQLEVGFLKKWTTFFLSSPQTKTVELFGKILRPIKDKEVFRKEDAKLKVISFSKKLADWGKKNNKKVEEVYDMFLSKDADGAFTGKLQYKIDKSFFTERAVALNDDKLKGDFLKNNYDMDAYHKDVDAFIAQQDAKIDGESTTNEQKLKDKEKLRRKYKDPKTAFTENNHYLHSIDETGKYRYIKEEAWYSPFYKELTKPGNEELLSFYEYMLDVNKRAKNTGLTEKSIYEIPHVLKGMIETGWNFGEQKDRYLASISADVNAQQFGSVDPITGLPREKRFLPYTLDLSKEKDGKQDYSQLSTDLARVFGAYEQSLIETEDTKDMESFFQILRDFEKASEVFEVNMFGKPKKDRNTAGGLIALSKGTDSDNYKYLDKYGRFFVYGQRLQDFKDMALPTPFKDREGNPISLSGVRLVQSTASLARMSVLGGINIASPIRNFIMGRLSTAVQKSPHFNSTSSLSIGIDFLQGFNFSLSNPKHQKMAASLAYFLPHQMSQSHFQDKVSMYSGYQILTPEVMMKILSKSEEFISLPVHFALMENSTVRNGEIVNINALVDQEMKEKYNYTNIYTLPANQQKDIEKEKAARVKELIKNDNLYQYIELTKNGKDTQMSIKGVERTSKSVADLRRLTQDYARKAAGSAGEDDFALMKTSFVGTMLSMFRSWIPRTVQARFGDFNRNNLTDSFEEGRMTSLWKTVSNDHQNAFKRLGRLLTGFVGVQNREETIKIINEIYEKKTSQLLGVNKISRRDEISQEEFTRMYLNNIQSAYNDMRTTAALLVLGLTGLLAGGAGDDDEDKNLKRILARELNKYTQEFTFYYLPQSAFQIIKDPFPILNFHSNIIKIATETAKLTYDSDKAHPAKYILRSLPISSFFVQYLPLFDEQLARDWNIRLNPNTFNR